MPLVRIDEDEIPFAGGELWKLPYEQYDQLSLGAFEDSRRLYERTAPVFYRVDMNVHFPWLKEGASIGNGAMIELKCRAEAWSTLSRIGFDFMVDFHDTVVDEAWRALVLASPSSSVPRPRLSVTFVVRGEEQAYFEVDDTVYDGIRIQGDADQELLFSPRATGTSLTRSTIGRANELLPVVEAALGHPELSAALEALGGTTHPLLSPSDQMTIAVTALEALLLPEVTSGIEETFAGRLGSLLAADEVEQKVVEDIAHELYDTRSARLHGSSGRASKLDVVRDAWGQRLLAAAIVALTERVTGGGDLDLIRAALDVGSPIGKGGVADDDIASSPPNRLSTREPYRATGWSTAGSLEAPEGTILSWSPLVGLRAGDPFRLGEHSSDGGVAVTSLQVEQVLSMEDKDVRRELSSLALVEEPVGCLLVGARAEALPSTREEDMVVARLLRVRELGVTALRLGGLTSFVDPELLGSYIFNGAHRSVEPTALRQTILARMGGDPEESVGVEELTRVAEKWKLLHDYETQARTADVDQVLALYRRCHDDDFLPGPTRAGLMIGTLEAMLGRFRPRDSPVQLEELVAATAGESAATAWFAAEGRGFRNAVAHGYWDGGSEPLRQWQEVLRGIVPAYLRSWLECEDRDKRRPARVLVERATALVGA